MNKALSTLVVGERVVAQCFDGALAAEYALFDRADVVLPAGPAKSARERGYLTTASVARARLTEAGVTASLARDVFAVVRGSLLRALAATPSVLRVIDDVGACEAFEGGTYSAAGARYGGTWLDLEALARACPLPRAAILLQALHLVLVLGEVEDDAPVRLLTAGVRMQGRPGERTWRKVSLEGADGLAAALQGMRKPARSASSRDDAANSEILVRTLRERARASTPERSRLHALAARLARAAGLSDDCEEPPFAEDARERTDAPQGEEHLRAVAQSLSDMAARPGSAPELVAIAARAWLAAGDAGRARRFAKQLVEDVDAPDSARIVALEILDASSPSEEASASAAIQPAPVVMLAAESHAVTSAGASISPTRSVVGIAPLSRTFGSPGLVRATFAGATPVAPRPELVETLPLPEGATEDMLQLGTIPGTPVEARIAMTRLARELGRDYRVWYRTTLRTDVVAIEAMQRHLRTLLRTPSDPKSARRLKVELLRHGALLSEILARLLGADWVDVSPSELSRWTMVVAPEQPVWPIGRVYRFFRQGHRESDLVSFYLELEADAKRSDS